MTPLGSDEERAAESVADVLRKRYALLERLADGPGDQRDLRDDLGVSRSTVYKALQELEAADLVAEGEEGYELTGFGRLAWRRHDTYLARLGAVEAARPLLESIPDCHRLPLSVFEHGRIVLPGRHAPERPLERMEELAEASDRLRVASSAGMPRYFSDIHERAERGDQTTTLLLEPAAIEHLRVDYDRFEAAAGAGGLELRVLETELPFALVLFDDSDLGLFAYDDGTLVGAAYTRDETALQWGEATFERFLERSTPA